MVEYNLLEGLTEGKINKMSKDELISYAKNKLDKTIEKIIIDRFNKLKNTKGILTINYNFKRLSDVDTKRINIKESFDDIVEFVNKVYNTVEKNKDELIIPEVYVGTDEEIVGLINFVYPNYKKTLKFIEYVKDTNHLSSIKNYDKNKVIAELKEYYIYNLNY